MSFFKKFKKTNFLDKIKDKAENILEDAPIAKNFYRKKKIKRYLRIAFKIFVILLIAFIVVSIITAISLKSFYGSVWRGKSDLETAIFLAKDRNFDQAEIYSTRAEKDFSDALETLQSKKKIFGIFPIIGGQLEDIEYLTSATEVLSRSASQAIEFGKNINIIMSGKFGRSFSDLNRDEKRAVLAYIYESSPELVGLKANLDLALFNLDRINYYGILFPVKYLIGEVETNLEYARDTLTAAIPASKIFPEIGGYPEEKSFLFLLQNPDELRPTGGFIGTYGVVATDSGDITRFETHDIYHLDMPLEGQFSIEPPEPIKNYLNLNWYMRDSNWSPDFPTTANQALWFYQKENKLLPTSSEVKDTDTEFDGVIAVTPEVFESLLKIVGPIEIEGVVYNSDNFSELLEYRVEKGYVRLGESSWQRKEVIGKIGEEIKTRLFDLDILSWPEALNTVTRDLEEKNILLNFKDADLEELVKEENMAGDIKNTGGDYLMVVDANMAAFKTDAVMNRKIEYSVDRGDNGTFATVKIHYSHNGDFDWKTTRYQTYTRVFVPLGSQLVSSQGITKGEVETGKELGKTYFGGFFSVEPGEIGTLEFTYQLPDAVDSLIDSNDYTLYIQKQPGSRVDGLSVELNFDKAIQSFRPRTFSSQKIDSNSVEWETDLNIDRAFLVE